MEHQTNDTTPDFMEWPDSTNIESANYTKDQGFLTVKFRNGGIYRYSNFPLTQWEEMLKAPSVGSFVGKHVRGKYITEKVS